ncbi:MAG: chemotaxis protein CheB [Undibacterium sp.]|uniref:chemotaxis protein CheB n=1 Tax=Undibacterium sp. TaxID=1914977 RepID=UPI002727D696|nr:chemotaxis protein CheB [Undibacterium sp.]MDO8653968.1 chemotaxis protein CheB [Undibacterium sp.]
MTNINTSILESVNGTPCIAGIGASAGGYKAIRNFFQAMPADSGVAFVIIQHLDPTHTSLSAELFAKCTAMLVNEATDGVLIEANHVYTLPSDKDITVQDGHLRLTPRLDHKHLRLPIDRFFNSLGEDCGTRAIGIVLSGSGTDGALGLKTIAAHEGIVLVQEPSTAEFDGMPRSAIATGIANYVLPVEQMPQVISDYAHHPYVVGNLKVIEEKDNPDAIQQLIKIIQARRGYDFTGYKRNTFLRRIQRRMGLHGILQQSKYIKLLEKDENEVNALFRDLLIGVTEFFRDADAWKTLNKDVISTIVSAKPRDEPIRVWIPGCSTGEEAYTMSMVILDRLRLAKKNCPVQIFATDTNNEALEIGRIGRYPAGITSRISPARLRRYFIAGPDHEHFVVSDELRSTVVFGIQNLFADPPFGRVDLISCRNVLIYLESELQKRVLNIFHFALRREGYLFLGSAESNGGRDDLFKPLSKRWRIFQREGKTRANMLTLPSSISDSKAGGIAGLITPIRIAPPLSQVASIAHKLVIERFAPATVLINSNNEALYFCGDTDDFLIRPRGAPTQDLLVMVREGLRSKLRTALQDAANTLLTVNINGVRMKRGNAFEPVQITVTPSPGGELGQLFLVVFRHDVQPSLIPIDTNTEGALVRHLEEELQATRDDLFYTIERFESVTDNLKNSNEEVVTTNEELRSLNEELESSKEELQSLNEELSTVNQQLEIKLHELEISNSDLHNLLISSDIATICLDQSLRIKWFAPAAQKQFRFIASDIGRPINDLLSAIQDSELIVAAHAVIAKQSVIDHEFQVSDGRWFMRRILPYKTESAQNDGIIVTYTDITNMHLAIEASNTSRRDLNETIERTDKVKALSVALAMAEERERRALAKYLHDDLGQIMAVIALKSVSIKKQRMSASLRLAIDDCAAIVDQANNKLREMALQLNPPMLDQLGLVTALEWMADEVHRVYNLDVCIEDDGTPKPMAPAVSATVFRAVRELLTNVSKHAHVEKATITTARESNNTLVISVSDAGAGFNQESITSDSESLGLVSLRERINLLGGEVKIFSTPGKGTAVILKVPLLMPAKTAKKTNQEKTI